MGSSEEGRARPEDAGPNTPLTHGASSALADVVARMERILEPLPQRDGIACFTRLYLEVTTAVRDELSGTTFAEPALLERLDVAFAGLFFDALEIQERDPARCPPAWRPLLEARSNRGIAPLQFALAGMNAHINRDLPVALVAVWQAAAFEPRLGSPQHQDYERVDEVLDRVEQKVKARYKTGLLNTLDRIVHPLDRLGDVVAMWDVRRARASAWANGTVLWTLRDEPERSAAYLLALDRMVGFAGRGLLVPADTTLRKVDRWLRGVRRDPLSWV
jgi:hypothetical protein